MNLAGIIFLIFFFSVLLLSITNSLKYLSHIIKSKKRDILIIKFKTSTKKGFLVYSIFCLSVCIVFLPFIINFFIVSIIVYFFFLSLEFFFKYRLTKISGIYRNLTWNDGYVYPNTDLIFSITDRELDIKYENKSEEKINIINRIPMISTRYSDIKPHLDLKILLTIEQINTIKREIVACYCT